jgi:hypothetical protein
LGAFERTPAAAAAAADGGGGVGSVLGGAVVDQLSEQLLQFVARHGHSWGKISTRMGLTHNQVRVLLSCCTGGGGAMAQVGFGIV